MKFKKFRNKSILIGDMTVRSVDFFDAPLSVIGKKVYTFIEVIGINSKVIFERSTELWQKRLSLEKGVFLKNSACAYELAYAYLSGKYGIDINKHKAGEYANLFNEFEKFGWPHCLEPSLTMKPEIHILSEIDEEIRKNWGCRR